MPCLLYLTHVCSQVSQVIGQMPQEQFQQLMGSMNPGGMPGAGMGGMPPGAGGAGGNVIRLSEEEGAAVARLTELGFDRTDAAQVRRSRIRVYHLVGSCCLKGEIGVVVGDTQLSC